MEPVSFFISVVDLSLTPDAAMKVHAMLGESLPELRALAASEPAE
jgi:hypothetical protein